MWDPRDQSPDAFLPRGRASASTDLAVRRLTVGHPRPGIHDPAAWGRSFQVPRRLGDAVGALPRLTLDASVTSPRDGFQKLRFRTLDGLAVETVLIPLHKPGAVSVCLSSQVGCAMGCAFCATARMPTRRNLATWEIIDQWVQARDLARSQGRRVTGRRLHGDGRAVPELRPRDRRRRAAPLPLRRLDRPPRRSRSAPSASSPRSTGTPPKGTSTGSRSASGPRPTPSGPGSSRRRADAGRRGHGRRPPSCPRPARPGHALLRLHLGRERRRGRRPGPRRADRRHARAARPDRRDRPDRPFPPPFARGARPSATP